MLEFQPFESREELHTTAEWVWRVLDKKDWLEAFASHPRIGDQPKSAGMASEWSRDEQAGTASVREDISEQLRKLNAEYLQRFGFLFIVCATGKPAEELVSALKERLKHSREQELHTAAAEQAKIMHLRLDKLLNRL